MPLVINYKGKEMQNMRNVEVELFLNRIVSTFSMRHQQLFSEPSQNTERWLDEHLCPFGILMCSHDKEKFIYLLQGHDLGSYPLFLKKTKESFQ